MQKDYLDVDIAQQIRQQSRNQTSSTENMEHRAEWRIMQRYLSPGAEIVDFGCGSGAWCHFLASKGHRCAGIDLNIETNETECNPRFVREDFLESVAPYRLDVVIAFGSLEHQEDGLQRGLIRAREWLWSSGLLFMTMPTQNLRHLIFGPPQPMSPAKFYQWRLTKRELALELSLAGFETLLIRRIHKYQGCKRWCGRGGILPGILSCLLPAWLVAHSLIAVAKTY